jgi:hypothetical protein
MNREESKAYDVRVLERNLRRGLVSRKDYEKYLKSLPDSGANAAFSRPEETHTRAAGPSVDEAPPPDVADEAEPEG